MSKIEGELAPKPPLYGAWNVDELAIDGQVRPPLLTDATRWRRVIFPYPELIAFQPMAGEMVYYTLKTDPAAHTLALTKWKDKKWQSAFSYKETGPGLLALEGTFDGKKVKARLRKVDPAKYPLISRGFHWINEYPYHR